jgi:hypothetical protein
VAGAVPFRVGEGRMISTYRRPRRRSPCVAPI